MQIPQLAYQIVDYIRSEGLAAGTRLPSRRLAEQFRVSRTPIERALRLLGERNVVSSSGAGFVVGEAAVELSPEDLGAERQSFDERLYLRMAEDHAADRLPEKMSENELMRRYEASRPKMLRVLHLAASEGWAERLPGRGWAFVRLLSPELTYEQVYRYRIVIEPAAILEPTFVLDRPAIEACRDEQLALFDSDRTGISPIEVFDIGSRFHETVLNCSRNPFFVRGFDHANRMRRLAEYRKTVSSPQWRERCREHARIAELLLDGDRAGASGLMRAHLTAGMLAKAPDR